MQKPHVKPFRLFLLALLVACVAVGLLAAFQNRLEVALLGGFLHPEQALRSLASLQTYLLVLLALNAAGLATVLAWLAKRVADTGQWPPSGWTAARALDAAGIRSWRRFLLAGAAFLALTALALVLRLLI